MNEQSIFNEALDRGDPAARSAYLDEACAGDLALRERVEALLTSHAEAGNFLGKLAPERIAEELKREQTDDETQGENPEENKTPEEDLTFLTPSDKSGALGRLGHYEVLEVIGRGGMGIVLRAFDDKLHRVVAIKVMATALASTSPPRKRFLREARAAAKVRHEHVVDIHAVEDQPIPYLVMEYVSGETLQQKLDRVGPLETPEVLRLGQQIARGLAAAHAQGLIHRDIKPSNILLEKGADERVKITDFGLARAADDASLTQSGMIAGTPMYMAPEQTLGEAIDHRADLFSLGSVLYTMCTGRPPFRATTSMATLKRVAEDQPRPIREIIPEVPQWLCAIIARLHAKKSEGRFPSAKEVADLLGQCIQHLEHPTSAPMPAGLAPLSPLGRGAGGEGRSQPATTTPFDGSGRATRRHRRLAVAAAVLLLVLGGFTLTEATGVTTLRATVIRIITPDGTLVVETDDPAVKVTVEGDGGLVITGAGLEEIRLRPGSYRVQADRDGKPIPLDKNLVEVARGGRAIVKVKLEAPAAAVAKAEKGAFVLLGGKGVTERKFDTLAEAVLGSTDGDRIEVRGNGPFVSDGVIANHPLVIRAGTGYTPSILLSKESAARNVRLIHATNGKVVLEGLELMRVGGAHGPVEDRFPQLLVAWDHGSLHIANCRLIYKADSPSLYMTQGAGFTSNAASLSVRNSVLTGNTGQDSWWFCESGGRYSIDNCVCAIAGLCFVPADAEVRDVSVRVRNNTLVGNCLNLTLFSKPSLREAGEAAPPLRLEVAGNVARWEAAARNTGFLYFHQAQKEPLAAAEAEAFLLRLVRLDETQNVYRTGTPMLRLVADWQPLDGKRGQDLADWNRFWGQKNTGSVEGEIRFQGGDLMAHARSAPEKLTAEDFRLRADSAGYRAGKDGKDLGADVDLVGPGPAYERWKRMPEY